MSASMEASGSTTGMLIPSFGESTVSTGTESVRSHAGDLPRQETYVLFLEQSALRAESPRQLCRRAIELRKDNNVHNLKVDLSAITDISRSELSCLLSFFDLLRQRGVEVTACSAPSKLLSLLRLVRAHQYVAIESISIDEDASKPLTDSTPSEERLTSEVQHG